MVSNPLTVHASATVNVLDESTLIAFGHTFPLLVSVPPPFVISNPDPAIVMFAPRVHEPPTVNWLVMVSVPVYPLVTLRDRHARAEVSVVMPCDPLLESRVTSSADVGALAPLDPPEVADQFVVLVQLPFPPVTRNRAAIASYYTRKPPRKQVTWRLSDSYLPKGYFFSNCALNSSLVPSQKCSSLRSLCVLPRGSDSTTASPNSSPVPF